MFQQAIQSLEAEIEKLKPVAESVQTELSAVYSGVKVTNVSGFASSKELEQETTEEQAIEIHIEFE